MKKQHKTTAAAVAGMALLSTIPTWAQTAITSLATTDVSVGPVTVRNGLVGFSNASPTPGVTTYDITYNGIERQITSFVAGGNVFVPDNLNVGTATVRRNTAVPSPATFLNQNDTTAWNAVLTGNNTTTAHTVFGRYLPSMDALYTSRNVLTGTENLFINQGDANNASSNVERVDYIFGANFAAANNLGFAIFERGRGPGGNGANGGFRVAAILAVDGGGTPTSFGSLVVSATDNNYGNTGQPSFIYDVFNGNPNLNDIKNVAIGPQGIAGALVRSTDLVPAGTLIRGYAVFGEDVTATGNNLVDWNNSTFYPQNSPLANDADMIASGALIYLQIPESASLAGVLGATLLVAAGGFWRHRPVR